MVDIAEKRYILKAPQKEGPTPIEILRDFHLEIGIPSVRYLDSKDRAMEKALAELVGNQKFIDWIQENKDKIPKFDILKGNKELRQLAKENASVWYLYASLNLAAGEKNLQLQKAGRFGHSIWADNGGKPLEAKAAIDSLKKTFTEEKNKFPWQRRWGYFSVDPTSVRKDIRLEKVDFEHINYVDPTFAVGEIKTKSSSPAIVVVNTNQEEKLLTEIHKDSGKSLLSQLINTRPFVLVVRNIDEMTDVHIMSNHEYIDGITSAYYLRKFIAESGMEHTDELSLIKKKGREFLELSLKEMDTRENSFLNDPDFEVKSVVIKPEIVKEIVGLFNKTKKKLRAERVTISFADFMQIFVLRQAGVEGKKIRGGVLGFRRDISEQLAHYKSGNIKELFELITSHDGENLKEAVKKAGFSLKDDPRSGYEDCQRIDLYDETKNNVSQLISPLKNLPPFYWRRINELSKTLNIARAATGQVMVSVIPEKIAELALGGIGGPACTEYQDAAYTVRIIGIKDKGDEDLKVDENAAIIVRRKFRKEIFDYSTILGN